MAVGKAFPPGETMNQREKRPQQRAAGILPAELMLNPRDGVVSSPRRAFAGGMPATRWFIEKGFPQKYAPPPDGGRQPSTIGSSTLNASVRNFGRNSQGRNSSLRFAGIVRILPVERRSVAQPG